MANGKIILKIMINIWKEGKYILFVTNQNFKNHARVIFIN